VLVGKTWFKNMTRIKDPDFLCRSTLVKWVYEYDFVNDFAELDKVKKILAVKEVMEESKEKPTERFFY